MEGLNNLLNELAKMLGVGTDALKDTLSVIGNNYKEVYSTLVREYTIYQVIHNLMFFSFIGSLLLGGFIFINVMATEEFKINKTLKIAFISCVSLLFLTMFGSVFYPNINIIMSLLDK